LNKVGLLKYLFKFITIFISCSLYSQNKSIDCDTISHSFSFYKVTVFKENNQPFLFNVIGDEIDFEEFSKDNLQDFINQLFVKNTFSPIVMDRNYYLNYCKNDTIVKDEELKFKYRFDNLFEKKSRKCKVNINLKTGEQILIEGVNFKGTILIVDKNHLNFEKVSIYPSEIYDCDIINKYYIPIDVYCIEKIKKTKC